MGNLDNFKLAGLEVQYVLGLVGIFVGICLLVSAVYHVIVEPIRQRRILNKRIRGSKREQEVRAQVFKTYQESADSLVLSLAERLFGWGRVENLQRRLDRKSVV